MLVMLCLVAMFAQEPEPVAKDELVHDRAVVGIAWSADSKLAITATRPGDILLWNGQTGARLATLKGHTKPIRDLSSVGDLLASLDTSGEVILWDLSTRKKLQGWKVTEAIEAIALRPDGKHLFGTDAEGAIRQWEVGTGKELRTLRLGNLKEQVYRIAFADRDRFAISSRVTLNEGSSWSAYQVYDLVQARSFTGRTDKLPADQREKYLHHMPHLAWSSDGKAWALVGETYLVLPKFAGRISLNPDEGPVVGVGLSPDGKQVVFATAKGSVRVHETDEKGKELARTDRLGKLMSFRLAPDGKRYLAVRGDRHVILRPIPTK